MDTTRCKMKCIHISKEGEVWHASFEAVISGSEENTKFFKYTPYGVLNLGVVSEETAQQWKAGEEYFIDIRAARG